MASQIVDYDSEEFRKLGAVLAALVAVREEEIASCCREVIDAAFADSPGRQVLEILRGSDEPLSLRDIASKCGSGKRSVLPEGRVRTVMVRLGRAGIVVNRGTPQKPRYSLDAGDRRVEILKKIYGPIRFTNLSGTL
ncbi:MAG: hypothetical protein OK441_00860 [Thaumarchaeota archaeon]|nr:hypothetical protein [Nitrososphaerota archaeon]